MRYKNNTNKQTKIKGGALRTSAPNRTSIASAAFPVMSVHPGISISTVIVIQVRINVGMISIHMWIAIDR